MQKKILQSKTTHDDLEGKGKGMKNNKKDS